MHRVLLALLLVAAGLPRVEAAETRADPAKEKITHPVLLVVEATARETYDDNIYTYEYGPLGHQASWITQGQVVLGLKCQAGAAGLWTPSYTWEGQAFHEASEESNQKHTARLQFAGQEGAWSWQGDLAQSYTDGSTSSPIWTGPGGAPAIGAPEVRNRRRNALLDHTAQIKWNAGTFWTRGLYRGQLHHFMTDHSTTPGYQNYVDRNDFSLGLDIGRTLTGDWDIFVGGRIGQEDQSRVAHNPVEFDNQYFRCVGGMQGHPLRWLKIDAEVGPDFRDFTEVLPSGEPGQRTEIYYRGTIDVQLTASDHLTFSGKQYLFPSSAGCGMMREGLWDAAFSHTFSNEASERTFGNLSAGFKVNEDDFFPSNRRDRVFTPRVEWKTSWNKTCTLRATYEYSWSESEVPNTPAREYTRSRLSVAASWQY